METELLDDLDTKKLKKENQLVSIVSGILFLLMLLLASFCYNEIVWALNKYAEMRGKLLLGAETLHGMVSTFFVSSIPVIAYNCFIRNKKRNSLAFYTILLIATACLFTLFLIAGLELLFAFFGSKNSLMPGVMILPPFSFYFDLMFILSAFGSFLLLRLYSRRKKTD